jgi:hypothetical protein
MWWYWYGRRPGVAEVVVRVRIQSWADGTTGNTRDDRLGSPKEALSTCPR